MRRALAIGILALAMVPGLAAAADNQPASGRRIFRFGGEAAEVRATFAASNAMLPPGVRRCAGCHGVDGAGTREGGVPTPPINWTALAAPRDVSPVRPGRPGYDDVTLKRALAEGIDAAGRPLGAGMPRFHLAPTQANALIDYLRIVGTDTDLDPGVAADEISFGAVLPLSGPQAAWGQAMQRGLEVALAAAGPIYGRRLRVVAVDAGDDVSAAVRRLVASDQVFAMVATLLPDGVEAAGEMGDMPVVGPLVPTPAQVPANRFHLLAPLEDQMRMLVDELAGETQHALRLAVIGPDGSVADAVADQARRNGATIVGRATNEDLSAVLPPTIVPAPDAVVALPGVDLNRLVAEMAGRSGGWRLAGPAEAVTLRKGMSERLRLVLPLLPHDPRQQETSVASSVPPLAAASAAILVEGVKRMGGRASRAGLIAALETVRDFPTGVLPPVSFGRGQHGGTRASAVIRPDKSGGIVALGGWRVPR